MKFLFYKILASFLFTAYCLLPIAHCFSQPINWDSVRQAYFDKFQPTDTPAWLFPIIFENANEDRDTIYLGYDPNAYDPTQPGFSGDSAFGEKLIKIDTSKFNMMICGSLFVDSVYKIMVSYDLVSSSTCGDISFLIYGASHAYLPLKMLWDVTLFRSDSLPFPNQYPAPKAQGLIWFDGDAGDSIESCSSWGDNPILVSDSVTNSFSVACVKKDSVTFNSLFSLYFLIYPWTGTWTSIENLEKKEDLVKIIPNPFKNSALININYEPIDELEFSVFDLMGRKIHSQILNSASEHLTMDKPNGIYFFHLQKNNTLIFTGKIIVQHF